MIVSPMVDPLVENGQVVSIQLSILKVLVHLELPMHATRWLEDGLILGDEGTIGLEEPQCFHHPTWMAS